MDKVIYPITIIGGGSAGIMALNRAALNNDQCLFFSGPNKSKKKSRALWVKKIDNMPGHLNYKRGIVEPNDEMLQWLKNSEFSKNIIHLHTSVSKLTWNQEEKIFELIDEENKIYYSKFVVLCTGMMDIQPEIKGSIKPILPYANAQDVEYCLRCDGHHVFQKRVGVIGHTSSAAWVAIMLFERYQPTKMSIFLNGKKSNFSPEELRILNHYEIKIYEEDIEEVVATNRKFNGFKFSNAEIVELDKCFVSLGVIVFNQLALDVGAKVDERGFVLTDEFGQCSIDRLYVAGDLRAGKKKQIYTAWDGAVDALDHINARIRKERRTFLE